ncbi:LemA family protein [Pontixanthobacter aestiaquae]|uniref:LemA family protein n=1 Tax=Pontixanthobacter aestiaquae TaxID=1509367 RepID=A0A844ZAN1_9SPHN|nr:LemA family protein [Pontixanthobacter aestiaquae]MDN3644866.1 LemA family protein [Pontixanthobacter aestiaquae]MXO84133.1 LemA family protein [Pontixanthobacter aestiaquae]
MNLRNFGRFTIAALASLTLAACGINSVPAAEETAKAKWADVEAAFQARANLLSNLGEIATSASDREGGILTDVIEARAKATSVQISADDLNDPAKMEAFQSAQNSLGSGLGRLLVNVERYPELKSNDNFVMLQGQAEGIENKIRIAIKDYNEAVRVYNTTIRTFPDTIGANIIHGAEPMVPYTAVSEGAEVAEDLDLGRDSGS